MLRRREPIRAEMRSETVRFVRRVRVRSEDKMWVTVGEGEVGDTEGGKNIRGLPPLEGREL
jgi:hypothetical protein